MATAVMERKKVGTSEPTRSKKQTGGSRSLSNQLLLLVSSPIVDCAGAEIEDLEPLSSRTELEAIAAAIGELGIPFDISLRFAVAGQRLELSRNDRPLFVHVAAHGMTEGKQPLLVAESPMGERQFLAQHAMHALLKPLGKPPCAIAVLNVCHSEKLARAFLDLGVVHVVAVDAAEPILAHAGQVFARTFYRSVVTGNTVRAAFDHARDTVLLDPKIAAIGNNLDEYLKLRLLPQDVTHDEVIILDGSVGGLRFPVWERTNLVEFPLYPFIGRQTDLYTLNTEILGTAGVSLNLITGMGGLGKTALVDGLGRWQHERSRWRNGVYKIEARDLVRASEIREHIAARLVPHNSSVETDLGLVRLLKDWHGLLILDDLDRVIRSDREGLREMLTALLGGCRNLRIIATLRHTEEFPDAGLYRVHEIKHLSPNYGQAAFESYLQDRLWSEDDQTFLDDIEELLKFLDGYPLAIKLAASYMRQKQIGLKTLCQRLAKQTLDTLRYPGEEDKATSLRVCLRISFDAMPAEAKDFYPILACFPAGITESMATAIFGESAVLNLEHIHSYSMVEIEKDHALDKHQRRFRLLEPARQFAHWHLEQLGSLSKYGKQAIARYVEFVAQHAGALREASAAVRDAEETLKRLPMGKDLEDAEKERHAARTQLELARDTLLAEHPNLEYWIHWSLDQGAGHALLHGCRVVADLVTFWAMASSDRSKDGAAWLEKAETQAERVGHTEALAVANEGFGELHLLTSQTVAAIGKLQAALASYEKVGKPAATARVNERLAIVLGGQASVKHLEAACRTYESLKETDAVARCAEELALVLVSLAEPADAMKQLQRAVQSYSSQRRVVRAYRRVAGAALDAGFTDEAAHAFLGAIQVACRDKIFIGVTADLVRVVPLFRTQQSRKKAIEILREADAAAQTAGRNEIAQSIKETMRNISGN